MARAQRIAAAIAGIAAILLASLALTAAVRADEDETTATAPENLHPTQVIAEIPDGYNELFPLQWGSGSLYQLKARLATMGCIANTIWNYDDDAWHVYNQYNVPSTLNAKWLAAYEGFVPPGTLYADCFDVCEFNYFEAPRTRPCVSPETFLERVKVGGELEDLFPYPIDASAECTDAWDERVMARVLPSMATYPDVCVIEQDAERTRAAVTYPMIRLHNALYPYYPSFIVLYLGPSPARYLSMEIHELCHTNQDFHIVQEMQPDKIRGALSSSATWSTTTAGSAFRDLTGFVQNADGEWSLPDDTYDGIYATNPSELAAELCVMYFIARMGEEQKYSRLTFIKAEYHYVLDKKDFDPYSVLTPDIVEWIETWVALPEIPTPETEEAAAGSASDAQSQ